MSKPMKFCDHAGCHVEVPFDVKYCDKHTKQNGKLIYRQRMERSKNAEHDYNRFYKTTAWKKLSRRTLQEKPICAECYRHGIVKMAKLVDHIVPIREDWSKRLDPDNLQSLCYECHVKKSRVDHARERKMTKFGSRPSKNLI